METAAVGWGGEGIGLEEEAAFPRGGSTNCKPWLGERNKTPLNEE